LANGSAISRMMVSLPPPAGHGTIMVTGFEGKSSAAPAFLTAATLNDVATNVTNPAAKILREAFIVTPPASRLDSQIEHGS
jgi:hypothetical protein